LRVFGLQYQWDETLQRLRNVWTRVRGGAGRAVAKVAFQVMVQSGMWFEFVLPRGEDVGSVSIAQPWFARACAIEEQNGDFIAECLLRNLPLDPTKMETWFRLESACDVFMLLLCFDRASVNFAVALWVWSLLEREGTPDSICPHAEPCWLHGVMLVKLCSPAGKQIVARMHTLACFLRFYKHLEDFSDSIFLVSRLKCELALMDRPVVAALRSRAVIEKLYGDLEVPMLCQLAIRSDVFCFSFFKFMKREPYREAALVIKRQGVNAIGMSERVWFPINGACFF
jgi:hypothetical protein